VAIACGPACGDPPGGDPTDGSPIDAAVDAGAIDAAISIDAGTPDGAPAPDADPDNPFGIRLTDVTDTMPERYYGGRRAGDPWGSGTGAAIADVDGDGDDDVVLARIDDPKSGRPGGPPALLVNGGGFGAFTESAAFRALLVGRRAHGVAAGDYDRDGDVDLFIACEGADVLLANDGSGSFADVTGAAGVGGPSDDVSMGAVWADLNGDGLLDLYVVAHSATAPAASDARNANRIYVNRADGTFADVTAASGAGGDGSSHTALIADLDGDGNLEIYVANDQFAVDGVIGLPGSGLDADAFYDRTGVDGSGTPSYADRAAEVGVDGPRSAMGVAMTDLDGDGLGDLYVSDWGANHVQVWRPGTGDYDTDLGVWELAARASPPGDLFVSWGVRFVDFDRDGWDEVYVVNGSISEPIGCDTHYQLDVLLRRPPDGASFVDISGAAGLPDAFACPAADDTPLEGRGVITGDLDGDGDDDVIVTPYVEAYRFYRNDTPQAGRHRARVRLRGTVSAPDPIGAVVRATLPGGRKLRRTLYGGGDTYSQSDRVLEVGLDGATSFESMRVEWPSGYVQTIAPPVDAATAQIVEPEWLALSARVAAAADPAPELRYAPVDAAGALLGAAGSGRTVTVTRSDGVSVTVIDDGAGAYTAALPHPGAARLTTLSIDVDGVALRPRLLVNYR